MSAEAVMAAISSAQGWVMEGLGSGYLYLDKYNLVIDVLYE
jgi:hypothetical protein